MSKTCYLGGPMRGLPFFNFPAFDEAAYKLRRDGWTVFSPAEKDRDHLDISQCPNGSEEELKRQGFEVGKALTWDFAHILDSHAVIFLPGWITSTGCHWEMAVAYATNKDIWEYAGDGRVPIPGGQWLESVMLFRLDPPAVVKNPTKCGLRYSPERTISGSPPAP
jgi:hypothetical protein